MSNRFPSISEALNSNKTSISAILYSNQPNNGMPIKLVGNRIYCYDEHHLEEPWMCYLYLGDVEGGGMRAAEWHFHAMLGDWKWCDFNGRPSCSIMAHTFPNVMEKLFARDKERAKNNASVRDLTPGDGNLSK